MKQIDNRQKQVIQSKAERTLKSPKKSGTAKAKEHVHLPPESEHPHPEGQKEEEAKKLKMYQPGPHVGRNDPCPCGSGKKYKKCCLNKSVQ